MNGPEHLPPLNSTPASPQLTGAVNSGSQLVTPDQQKLFARAVWKCYIEIYHWALPYANSSILIGCAMWQLDGKVCHMAIKRRLVPKQSDPYSPISTAQGNPFKVCFIDLHDRTHLAQLLELFQGTIIALPKGTLRKRVYRAIKRLRVSLSSF